MSPFLNDKTIYSYPEGYDPILAARVCNGCGPEGWKGIFIPDDILGVSFKHSCRIHDFEFWLGGTLRDFDIANERFLKNMYKAISISKNRRYLNPVRRFFARKYVESVKRYGLQYFNFVEANNA
jgi:hypothetical protein